MIDDERRARKRAYQAAYRERNREKRREVWRRWYDENRATYYTHHAERIKTQKASAYQRDKAKIRASQRKYYAANKQLFFRANDKRRALMAGVSAEDAALIAKWRARWRAKRRVNCFWCGDGGHPMGYDADHIMPLSKGGDHLIENMCIACDRCNLSKKAALPKDWNRRLAEPVLL